MPFLFCLFLLLGGTFTFEAYGVSSHCKKSLDDPYQKVQCPNENLSNRNFSGKYMPKGIFNASKMKGTIFDGATLTSAQFIKGVFNKHTSFRGETDLSQALFLGAKLPGTHFEDAILHGAQFKLATLVGAQFQRALLIYARFQGADIQDANFRDSHLMGANLSKVKNFHEAHFKGAKYNTRTIFPEGFPENLKAQMKLVN